MRILEVIQKYLDEKEYPSDWRVYYGGYDGLRVEWTADNGAHCQMDAWMLLNRMISDELKETNRELPRHPEELILLTHQK